MSDRQYSVSFPRQRRSTGPNPIENRSTPTPTRRATRKWPSSWIRMSSPMTTTNDRIVVNTLTSGARGDEAADRVTGPRIRLDALLNGREGAARMAVERPLDELGNFHEADPPVEECRDSDLVGGVHHGRRKTTGVERRARQPETRKAVGIRGVEREAADAGQIEPRRRRRPPL